MDSTRLPPGGRTDFGAPGATRVLHVGSDVQLFCDDFLLTSGTATTRLISGSHSGERLKGPGTCDATVSPRRAAGIRWHLLGHNSIRCRPFSLLV